MIVREHPAERFAGRSTPVKRNWCTGIFALAFKTSGAGWAPRARIASKVAENPRKITIAGESAGSVAVSAQMASLLSRI